MMLLVQLFFVENLLNAFLVLFQNNFSPLVTIPSAPIINGVTKHFIFHIRWISILKCFYFNLFSAPSVLYFHLIVLLHLSVCKFYHSCFQLLCLAYFPEPLLSVCSIWFHSTVIFSCWHTNLCMWGTRFPLFQFLIFCILSNVDVCRLFHVLNSVYYLP
jgi:hypothetical protein